jgi:hypothetical protein
VFVELAGMPDRVVAAELNKRGLVTYTGRQWRDNQVWHIRRRLGLSEDHRGGCFITPETRVRGQERGRATRQAKVQQHAEKLRPVFAELAGMTNQAAADELGRRGINTRSGASWSVMAVLRIRKLLGLSERHTRSSPNSIGKNSERRREYNREYMRKRRRKLKNGDAA